MMEGHQKRFGFPAGLLAGFSLCLIAQTALRRGPAAELTKGESNFFSSIARVQAAARSDNPILLVGSSITGRLPGRQAGNSEVGNIGVDGGSSLEGLKLIDSGLIPCDRAVALETNTLVIDSVTQRPTYLVESLRGLWFKAGVRVRTLDAGSRPTSIIFGLLLKHRNGAKSLTKRPFTLRVPPSVQSSRGVELSVEEREIADRVISHFKGFKSRGVKVLLVTYPRAEGNTISVERGRALAAVISDEAQVLLLDLQMSLDPADVEYTDAAHMTPASSARVLGNIQEIFDAMPVPGQ